MNRELKTRPVNRRTDTYKKTHIAKIELLYCTNWKDRHRKAIQNTGMKLKWAEDSKSSRILTYLMLFYLCP
jgi:hypothetical protein